jgi:glycosyltransferase involved in cell wall biosynthesis
VTGAPFRAPLRKVVIVNTADQGGGAERQSMAVLDGLTALGLDTWLLVGQKHSDHPRVLPLYHSPVFDYRPYDRSLYKAALNFRRGVDRWLGLEDFNHPYSHRILELTGTAPDLVLCHNLHGGFFDIRALAPLSRRLPVLLQLFDTWLMTGHCANPLGCRRWRNGCGACPDLTIPPAVSRDLTRLNWHRKHRILRGARLHVAAESQWMLDRAKHSLLADAVAEWNCIPGGIDLETFSPGSRNEARHELGLDPAAHIALYVANQGSASPFKDFATVRRALSELASRAPNLEVLLLIAGADGPVERLAPGIVIRHLGYIRSAARLARLYRAADVYVHAAIDEPFGLSVAEAMACGSPVAMASSGGVLEVVEHGRTALVAAPGDAAALAQAVARILADPAFASSLGAAAAATAKATLDRQTMITALHAWCRRAHETWAPWWAPSPRAG